MNAIRPLPVVDSLLAATANVHRMTFVTRNAADVQGVGARVLKPFTAQIGRPLGRLFPVEVELKLLDERELFPMDITITYCVQ